MLWISAFVIFVLSALPLHAENFQFGTNEFRDSVIKRAAYYHLRVGSMPIQNCTASQSSDFGARYCDTFVFEMRTRLWYNSDTDKISLITIYPTRYTRTATMQLAVSLLIATLEPSISDEEVQQMASRLLSAGSRLTGNVVELGEVTEFSGEITPNGYLFRATPARLAPNRH